MNYISEKRSMRQTPHYAALVFSSIHIPGDERSRTNPGHGYPAEDKGVVEYIAFHSREEMERWVQDAEQPARHCSHKDYQIIEAKPLTVKVTASVAVG